jgi:hypothetical protein
MRITLFTESALNSRHGTGDQLLACLAVADFDLTHLYND